MCVYVCVCVGEVYKVFLLKRAGEQRKRADKRNSFCSLPSSQCCLVTVRCLELLNPLMWLSDARAVKKGKSLGFWWCCGAGQSTSNCSYQASCWGPQWPWQLNPFLNRCLCPLHQEKMILYTTHVYMHIHLAHGCIIPWRHLVLKSKIWFATTNEGDFSHTI